MDLSGARQRVDHPNPFHPEGQVLADFFEGFACGVVGGVDLHAEVGRFGDNSSAGGYDGLFGDNTNIGYSNKVGPDSDSLFRYGVKAHLAAHRPQNLNQVSLYVAVFPGRQGAFDNPSFDEFGIVLEAGVQVLFGGDEFCDCHGALSHLSAVCRAGITMKS